MLSVVIVAETQFDVSVFIPLGTFSGVFGSVDRCNEVNAVRSLYGSKFEVSLAVCMECKLIYITENFSSINCVVRLTVITAS